MENIGSRIRELRILSNLSQEELGRRVGVQRAAIQKYEKGTVTNIPIHVIEKLASVFEVTPMYLLGWQVSDFTTLSFEVRVLQGVKSFYGDDAVEVLEGYNKSSKEGKKKILQYSRDICELYQEQS